MYSVLVVSRQRGSSAVTRPPAHRRTRPPARWSLCCTAASGVALACLVPLHYPPAGVCIDVRSALRALYVPSRLERTPQPLPLVAQKGLARSRGPYSVRVGTVGSRPSRQEVITPRGRRRHRAHHRTRQRHARARPLRLSSGRTVWPHSCTPLATSALWLSSDGCRPTDRRDRTAAAAAAASENWPENCCWL